MLLISFTLGAGGMLCTKAAYWIFPYIDQKLFHSKKNTLMMAPFYIGSQTGNGMQWYLK